MTSATTASNVDGAGGLIWAETTAVAIRTATPAATPGRRFIGALSIAVRVCGKLQRMSTSFRVLGLHHVTATVDDAQADLTFCLDGLGLRLVKKTVNFDNHHVYHFYYGD